MAFIRCQNRFFTIIDGISCEREWNSQWNASFVYYTHTLSLFNNNKKNVIVYAEHQNCYEAFSYKTTMISLDLLQQYNHFETTIESVQIFNRWLFFFFFKYLSNIHPAILYRCPHFHFRHIITKFPNNSLRIKVINTERQTDRGLWEKER